VPATVLTVSDAEAQKADAPEIKREGIPMSDFERTYATDRSGAGAGRAVAIDSGLRAYMIRVYNYMAGGVGLTGIVAWLTFQAAVVTDENGTIVGQTSFGQAIFGGPAVIVLMLGTLGWSCSSASASSICNPQPR
jgi:FtsH-binding integral membrane protein